MHYITYKKVMIKTEVEDGFILFQRFGIFHLVTMTTERDESDARFRQKNFLIMFFRWSFNTTKNSAAKFLFVFLFSPSLSLFFYSFSFLFLFYVMTIIFFSNFIYWVQENMHLSLLPFDTLRCGKLFEKEKSRKNRVFFIEYEMFISFMAVFLQMYFLLILHIS